ncbi:PREDICTED: uncharacterized protein LOC109592100 [Amphimedon queenslandica]|uniref:Uncharacterized protein n=2 Tax=Amphimedon queenslandica TaxID=400682 RepID=A0AAN0K240_AMPQE|nr:PREDICTED: uncharacterized protein LOC109592100 [Amphimedon queenslandica]|eukprot:XP_019863211.1 PREDICTED: uncharacterized protein LOC109592100 [Amphimedon queenslandica]
MHAVFEGVAATQLQVLLPYLIEEKKFFTLDQLNLLIRSHSYGYSEVQTKPSQIKKDDTYHVKQSASQMMTLIRLLPFLSGSYIDDDDVHWDCYCLLWLICDMIVKAYLECFTFLYSHINVTPKMHYLIHLPEQMELFGPLRHHWCMRFECKNAQIKGFVTNCFKNVPFSVDVRHQQWLLSSCGSAWSALLVISL